VLIWLFSPTWKKGDPDTNAESASIAGTNPTSTAPEFAADADDKISQDLGHVRDRLREFEQSLSAKDLDECPSPPLDQIRNQAELFERDLYSTSPPSADPVDAQLENIRRRLEQLKQDIGRRFE
jgi:hypothetical protein